MKSLINSFGYNDGGAAKGVYPDMLAKLDKLALAFANEFNSIHGAGTDLKGVLGKPFFVALDGAAITASSISIDSIFNPIHHYSQLRTLQLEQKKKVMVQMRYYYPI